LSVVGFSMSCLPTLALKSANKFFIWDFAFTKHVFKFRIEAVLHIIILPIVGT
jgi:hypothetical protein